MSKIKISGREAREMRIIIDKLPKGNVIVENNIAYWSDEIDDIDQILNDVRKETKKEVPKKKSQLVRTGDSLLEFGDGISDILVGRGARF